MLHAERRRSLAATQARKLFEGAEREVRQLRLACIHPQMTAYWRNLSAEMQLDSVSHLLLLLRWTDYCSAAHLCKHTVEVLKRRTARLLP